VTYPGRLRSLHRVAKLQRGHPAPGLGLPENPRCVYDGIKKMII